MKVTQLPGGGDHGRFQDLAERYARFRPGLPAEVAAQVAAEAKQFGNADAPLLDLGTGTGQVVLALADAFPRCVAVDSDKGMIVHARQRESGASPSASVEWFVQEAEAFVAGSTDTFGTVTIVRAFHWMDQAKVLDLLDRVVSPSGAVYVMGDGSLWNAPDHWAQELKRLVKSFLGEQRRVRQGVFTHHDRPYSEIIEESPFSDVEKVVHKLTRPWTIDNVLGYLFSTTFSAPELYGDRVAEFEAAARSSMERYVDADGRLYESVSFDVVRGRRP